MVLWVLPPLASCLKCETTLGLRLLVPPESGHNIHQVVCKTQNSLKYQHGAELSDGEAPKQLWAVMNPVAKQMKEMQPEVRHDVLEDKADYHNFEKNIGMRHLLECCLKLVLEERQVEDKAFNGIDATLKDELRADWMGMLDAWSKDHTQPNLYMVRLKKQCM